MNYAADHLDTLPPVLADAIRRSKAAVSAAITHPDGKLELAPAVAAALEGGLSLYVTATFDNDYVSGPRWVKMHLDADWLAKVARLMHVCAVEDAESIRLSRSPADWDEEGSEVSIRYWSLDIDQSSFHWIGTGKGDGRTQTRMIDLASLLTAIDVGRADDQSIPDYFGWYGGALLYESGGDINDLIDLLEQEVPELAAKERELEMADVIEQSEMKADQDVANDAAPAKRKGPTL